MNTNTANKQTKEDTENEMEQTKEEKEKEREQYFKNVLNYQFPDEDACYYDLMCLEIAISEYEQKMEKLGISKRDLCIFNDQHKNTPV